MYSTKNDLSGVTFSCGIVKSLLFGPPVHIHIYIFTNSYGEDIVARGPELVSTSGTTTGVAKLTFSNSSLSVHAGIYVGTDAECAQAGNLSGVVMGGNHTSGDVTFTPLQYTIDGATITVQYPHDITTLHVNSDQTTCFLYGPTGLPSPGVVVNVTNQAM